MTWLSDVVAVLVFFQPIQTLLNQSEKTESQADLLQFITGSENLLFQQVFEEVDLPDS